MAPRKYGDADVAAALGAAYVAARTWAPVDHRPERLARYRAAVAEAGSGETLSAAAVARLAALAGELRLDAAQMGTIEREVMGETKEARLARRPSVPNVQDLHGRPAEVVQRLQRETAAALGVEVVFRHRLEDGGEGPELVVILPVESFQPNPFGLYQVHGNVWEWCQDQWHGGYAGAPADGSAWETGGELSRVLRGGSWLGGPGWCRAACRGRSPAGDRDVDGGFRVCCGAPIE